MLTERSREPPFDKTQLGVAESVSLTSQVNEEQMGEPCNFGVQHRSLNHINASMATAVNSFHFTNGTPSEAITGTDEVFKTEESIGLPSKMLEDYYQPEYMTRIEEEFIKESPMEINTDRQLLGVENDPQLLSNRNWKKLDPNFFAERNNAQQKKCRAMQPVDTLPLYHAQQIPSMSSDKRQMTKLTGSSVHISSDVRRADLFVKGSPTINFDTDQLQTHHNFTMTARNIRRHNYTSNGTAGTDGSGKLVQLGTGKIHNDGALSSRNKSNRQQQQAIGSEDAPVQWTTSLAAAATHRKYPLQTSQGMRPRNRLDLKSIDNTNKTAKGWKKLDARNTENISFISRSIDHAVDIFYSDIVGNSFEVNSPIVAKRQNPSSNKKELTVPESRWKMGRVVTGAFNTVDYSAASSTARETYSKGKRRSSPEVVVLAKASKINRRVMSRSTQGEAQTKVHIKKFSVQPMQIYSDLEAIHRKIDEGEIKLDVDKEKHSEVAQLESGHESLANQALQANKDVQSEAKASYAVYIDALQMAIAALPMPQGREYQQLVKRIYDGFKNQNAQMSKYINNMLEMNTIASDQKDKQLKDVTEEFEKYRSLNDLDTYFQKNLSDDSRERVLENVKALMKVTDWHQFDKMAVLQSGTAEIDIQRELNHVLRENDYQQKKKAEDLAREREDGMFDKMRPPMTVKAFKDCFEDDLNEKVIKRSVDKSVDVAHQFIEKFTMKSMRNQGIQTNSIDELFAEHTYVINNQRKALKAAKIHETSIMAELNRISQLLRESREQQVALKLIADQAETARNYMVDSFDSKDNQITALLLQVSQKQEKIEAQGTRIKQLDSLLVKQKSIEIDLKVNIARLRGQVEDMGIELDKTEAKAIKFNKELTKREQEVASEEIQKKLAAKIEVALGNTKSITEDEPESQMSKHQPNTPREKRKQRLSVAVSSMQGTEPSAQADSPFSVSRNESTHKDDDSPYKPKIASSSASPKLQPEMEEEQTPPEAKLSPMPSERKREKPIIKYNADLPKEPGESTPKASKVKKHLSQRLPKQKQKEKKKQLNIEPIQVKPLLEDSNANESSSSDDDMIDELLEVEEEDDQSSHHTKQYVKSAQAAQPRKDKTELTQSSMENEESTPVPPPRMKPKGLGGAVKKAGFKKASLKISDQLPAKASPKQTTSKKVKTDVIKEHGSEENVRAKAKSTRSANRQSVLQKLPDGSIMSANVSGRDPSSLESSGAVLKDKMGRVASDFSDVMDGQLSHGEKETIGTIRGSRGGIELSGSGELVVESVDIKVMEQGIEVADDREKVGDALNTHGGIQTGIGTQVSFHMNSDQNTVMDLNYCERNLATRRDTLQFDYGNRESMQIIQSGTMEQGQNTQPAGHESMLPASKCDNVIITKKTSIRSKKVQHQQQQQRHIEFAIPATTSQKPQNLRDNTAQTALEFEILYACDMLLEELAGGRSTNRRQSLLQRISENESLWQGLSKKEAARMAEQLVTTVEKIRQRAAQGLFVQNLGQAATTFSNQVDSFVDIHAECYTDQQPSWHFQSPEKNQRKHQKTMPKGQKNDELAKVISKVRRQKLITMGDEGITAQQPHISILPGNLSSPSPRR